MSGKYFILLLALTCSMTVMALSALAQTTVPTGLEGQNRLAAFLTLRSAGFMVTLQYEPSCAAATGLVSSVNPPGGTIVTANPPRVTLGISIGGVDYLNAVTVPNLRNMPFAQAEQTLLGLGLKAFDQKDKDEERSDSCGRVAGPGRLIDSVTSTRPTKGTIVCPGTSVAVHRRVVLHYSYPDKKGQLCD